jgi:hypothetical protein
LPATQAANLQSDRYKRKNDVVVEREVQKWCIRLHPRPGVTGAAIDLFTGQVNDRQTEMVNE